MANFYSSLNDTDPPKITTSFKEIAKLCVDMNYGAHRFLYALSVELRADQARYNKEHKIRNPEARYDFDIGSELADGIESMLNKGYYK